MPKLLKQVWKTFYGSFFETEEEAARAEIHWKADAAITAAWEAAMAPIKEADEKRRAEYQEKLARRGRYGDEVPYVFFEADNYRLPRLFQSELLRALEKEGVLAEPKLSSTVGG